MRYELNSTSPIILALDYETKALALDLARRIDPRYCHLKIGPVLFTRYGPALLEELMAMGFSIFLDLKFHDIPKTVYGAIKSAADLGIWMLNVHVAGGRAMMEMAREAVDQAKIKPVLLGVTVLTSLLKNDLDRIGIHETVEDEVLSLAKFANDCGLDGVVCSAGEAKLLREHLGDDFVLVTPGIRLSEDHLDDQKRVKTPAEALSAGANYLVIGRTVTLATDPLAELEKIYLEVR